MPERVGFKVLPISTKSRLLLRERPETVGEEQEPPCIYAREASENPTLPARLVVNLISTDATGEVISIYDAHGKELLSLATIPRGIDSHRFPGEWSQRGRQGICGSRCLWCEKMLGWGD